MKRTIAAILTAVVAVALVAVGVTGAATASTSIQKYGETFTYNGSNSWTVVNTANLTSLHAIGNTQEWLCLGQNGIPACQDGASYTFVSKDFNQAGQSCAYVQHDGGDAWDTVSGDPDKAVCADEPTTNTAAAAIATIAPTCTSGELLSLLSTNLSNASWGTPTYTTNQNGTVHYSVVATATQNFNFANGDHTKTFTGDLAAADHSLCAPIPPTCITKVDAHYSYVFAANDAGHSVGGTVTVTGPAGSAANAPLCADAILYVRSTTWNYDLPTTGTGPSWYQTLDGIPQDVTVNTLGTFHYAAPDVTGTCQQHDIYATFNTTGFAALAVPNQLKGPGNPYEPAFLSSTITGTTSPTYSYDSTVGCTVTAPTAAVVASVCQWDASQHASFKTATITFDNSVSNVPVVFTVTGYPAYTKTVAAHSTATVTPSVPVGGATYTVVANGQSFPLSVAKYTACPPVAGVPAAVTFTDVCGTSGDTVTIPADTTEYAYTKTVDSTDNSGVRTVTVVATPKGDFTFANGVTTSWTHVFKTDAQNDCVVLAGDPTAHNPTCALVDGDPAVSGYITVILSTGVTYTIHNLADGTDTSKDVKVLGGDTDLPQGSYLVTASAQNGFVLASAKTQFPLSIGATPTNCDLTTFAAITPSVTAGSPVCADGTTTSGYLQIDPTDGLNYFIGNTQLTAAKTPMAPGTYSVRAVPVDPADTVDTNVVSNPMTVVVGSLAVACGSLATLAFTGGSGPSGFLIAAGILLMFGGVLIFTRKRRSTPRHAD